MKGLIDPFRHHFINRGRWPGVRAAQYQYPQEPQYKNRLGNLHPEKSIHTGFSRPSGNRANQPRPTRLDGGKGLNPCTRWSLFSIYSLPVAG